jgi:hypothetical protein
MLSVVLWLLAGSFFPRVEDPWPESIGLDFPLAVSGAFGMLAGLAFVDSPAARRDRAIRLGGLVGFIVGTLLYLVSLGVQVSSRG